MAKLTKELRDRCAAWLRNLSPSANGGSCGHCVGTVRSLADALAACEVEAEPVLMQDARLALEAAGWHVCGHTLEGECHLVCFHRGNQYLRILHNGLHVVRTRFCPPDLLDGRLAALNEEASRG